MIEAFIDYLSFDKLFKDTGWYGQSIGDWCSTPELIDKNQALVCRTMEAMGDFFELIQETWAVGLKVVIGTETAKEGIFWRERCELTWDWISDLSH